MHKKPYTYTESSQELIKRIELEKEFAKYLAKDLMSQRFGITTYCSTDRYDSILMKKELCDWDSLKKPIQSRTYSNITWRRDVYTNPNPDWLQWGEIPGCAGNPCGADITDPVGSSSFIWVDILLDNVLNEVYFPNFSGNAELYAFASSDGNSPWITVGRASLPVNASSDNLGGAIIVSINGQLYYRYQLYIDQGIVPNQGANQNDQIKFILVDGGFRWKITFANASWPTVDGTDPNNNVVPAASIVEGCLSCYGNITIDTTPQNFLNCSLANQDCWFCGMAPNNPENPFPTPQEMADNEDLYPAFSCVDDQECIYVEVFDQYNNPIPNYQVVVDGELMGFTNEDGVFKFTIPNASTNNFHTINDCEFCFYTSGNCNQQKITIRVNTDGAQAPCTIRTVKLDCKQGTYVDATIVDPYNPPPNVNTSWTCDSVGNQYNGCIEIIDSEGVLGYSTQEECLENCQAPEEFRVWRCVPNGLTDCYCSSTYSSTPANGVNSFATQQECENCEDCCCNPRPIIERIWRCVHDETIKIETPEDDCEQEVCTSQLVNGPIDWNNVPFNFFQTQQDCINDGCGCDEDITEPITHYCQSGECLPVPQSGFIPPFIQPSQQYTSLEDCENLCGASGMKQQQLWVPESWVNETVQQANTQIGATYYSDVNGDGACCVFDGYVDMDYNYAQVEFSTQQDCEAMIGSCNYPYTPVQEILSDFPYICLESRGTPEEGLFVWTPEAYSNLNIFPNFNSGTTLQSKMLEDNFYCKYYDGFDLSNCIEPDGDDCTGDTPGTKIGRLKAADPNRLFQEGTKFVIIPIYWSQNGNPWDGSIAVGDDTNGYNYENWGVTGGNYYQWLPQGINGNYMGTYNQPAPSVYENYDPNNPGGFHYPGDYILPWTSTWANSIHVFTDQLDPNYASQYYYQENPEFIPACNGDDCVQMQGLNLDPELTALVNSFHFKNTIANLHPDKIGINYWDWVFQESTQTSEAHGLRTGGSSNYYQAHIMRFGPVTPTGGEDLTQGARVSIHTHNNAPCYVEGNFWQQTFRPNCPFGADFFRMGGVYYWLAFTLDEGYEAGGADNIATMFIGNTNITKVCNGDSCAANQNDAIDCTYGAPFTYNINPDQTL